jgi:FlaA1/EpsC-like NDP-sugar epimerase
LTGFGNRGNEMEYIGRIENDNKLHMNETGIVIFGAGKDLEKLLDKLEKMHEKDKITCICDNNPAKQGKEVRGIKIVSPDYALRYYSNAAYIVYNKFCIEICRQLAGQRIEKIHLIRN